MILEDPNMLSKYPQKRQSMIPEYSQQTDLLCEEDERS